jgi:hypothetical protein
MIIGIGVSPLGAPSQAHRRYATLFFHMSRDTTTLVAPIASRISSPESPSMTTGHDHVTEA